MRNLQEGDKYMDIYLNRIKEISDDKIEEFIDSGHAVAGNNGSYNNCDTPIRNTAHWLIIYGFLWETYKEKKYLKVVKIFAEYLISEEHYGKLGSIRCRNDKNTDDVNGLIGQAWAIEGLVYASQLLDDEKYYNMAVKIFKSQKFDNEVCIWKIIDTQDVNLGYDYVYNHQLWFAAAGSLILDCKFDKQIHTEVEKFLDNYKQTFVVQPSGLIYHLVNCHTSKIKRIKFLIKMIIVDFSKGIKNQFGTMVYLEEGYHLFNLYGFALLYDRYKGMEIFKSHRFKRSLLYGMNKKTVNKLIDKQNRRFDEYEFNKYSYPYNSPAFEYPFISLIFDINRDEEYYKHLLNNQYKLTYNNIKKMFSENNFDEQTLTARMYELVRYFQHRKKELSDEK